MTLLHESETGRCGQDDLLLMGDPEADELVTHDYCEDTKGSDDPEPEEALTGEMSEEEIRQSVSQWHIEAEAPLTLPRSRLPLTKDHPGKESWLAAVEAMGVAHGMDGFNALLLDLAPFLESDLDITALGGVGLGNVPRWLVRPGAKVVQFRQEKSLISEQRAAYEIDWESIQALCPAEAQAFMDTLERYGVMDTAFAELYSPGATEGLADHIQDEGLSYYDDWLSEAPCGLAPACEEAMRRQGKEGATAIYAAWSALQQAFATATRSEAACLRLGIGSLEVEDDADDPDERVVYTVEGASTLTPGAQKFKSKLRRVSEVWFNY
jgi:hypothetical protein